jgi:hypothetical protein
MVNIKNDFVINYFFSSSLLYIDINECIQSPCHPNAICTNTYGNFTCECKRNYIGNGFFCKPINDEGEKWEDFKKNFKKVCF